MRLQQLDSTPTSIGVGKESPMEESLSLKITACFQRVLAGCGGALIVALGGAVLCRAASGESLKMLQPLLFSAGAGLFCGVLSENKKEAALNAALINTLIQSILVFSAFTTPA